ncbi:MAG: glycosyltransferase family 2 protein [Leptospiraceae bacterium]|nr:glycosyltransferase family 2 protein [candidate division KSB1 bacterium]MCP5498216.1 glycosyltransferase family 2 protein [Leptospiraceae bacterium]
MKTITIAIPSYNSEKFIVDALDSIFEQSYPVDEILVIDDHSDDSTAIIVKKYTEKHNINNLKLIINPTNIGYQKNWNQCLELAQCEYVLLLHSDDKLKPDILAKQIKMFSEKPELALVGGKEDFIDENGVTLRQTEFSEERIYSKGQIYEFVTEQNSYIPCSSVLFNMERIRKIGFFQPDVLATDEFYWPKVLYSFPIAVLGESLVNRRSHKNQAEYTDFLTKHDKVLAVLDQFMSVVDLERRPQFKDAMRQFFISKFSNACINISSSVLKYHKNPIVALRYLIYTLRINPKIVFVNRRFYKSFLLLVLTALKLDNVTLNHLFKKIKK